MESEYEVHWERLRSAVDLMLVNPDNESTPTHKISFEETYSAVYKCVCDHRSDQLYADLMSHVSAVVRDWRERLNRLAAADPVAFVTGVDECTAKFVRAIPVIVPIFAYMNRFYVVPKMGSDLQVVLINLYEEIITGPLVQDVIKHMSELRSTPFSISPAVMTSLAQNLHRINPNYAHINPALFSAYLTGVAPPMVEADLEAQRLADRALQEGLIQSGFNSGGADKQSRKRTAELLDCDDD